MIHLSCVSLYLHLWVSMSPQCFYMLNLSSNIFVMFSSNSQETKCLFSKRLVAPPSPGSVCESLSVRLSLKTLGPRCDPYQTFLRKSRGPFREACVLGFHRQDQKPAQNPHLFQIFSESPESAVCPPPSDSCQQRTCNPGISCLHREEPLSLRSQMLQTR